MFKNNLFSQESKKYNKNLHTTLLVIKLAADLIFLYLLRKRQVQRRKQPEISDTC